ncbi:MAG: hypothetical protein JWM53_192 [bacterium]|nr:hypothetical protein [bacterium]
MTRAQSLALALVAVAVTAERGAAEETHRAELRLAHIAGTLAAVRQTPAATLQQQNDYAHLLGRGACSSSVQRLKVECLMTAARRYCRGKGAADTQRCQAGMDIILSNLVGDAQLIPLEKRYRIMTRFKDYRRELGHELRRIQGALAVDLRLRMGDAADDARLARDIDQYCLATTDENNLAWPTCVSSLVWFIGTEP